MMLARRARALLVFGVLWAAAGMDAPMIASGYAEFRTPGEAAYCGRSEGEAPVTLICWTPNDGFTVSMSVRGSARKRYAVGNRGLVQNLAPVLRFGRSERLGSFVCHSRRSGLTCTNRRGHGWWLCRLRTVLVRNDERPAGEGGASGETRRRQAATRAGRRARPAAGVSGGGRAHPYRLHRAARGSRR
jgi:hypothetical protein